jgi:surface antigen
MKKNTLISVSLSMLLVGCAEVNNEQVGMVTGGVVGGLLGSQFGSGAGKVAAAAGGAFIGTVLGGRIGKYMDRQDRLEMQRALETAPTGRGIAWTNPDNGNRYNVTPTRTYYVSEQPCREYTTKAEIGGKTEQIYGKACRQADGAWKVVS